MAGHERTHIQAIIEKLPPAIHIMAVFSVINRKHEKLPFNYFNIPKCMVERGEMP